MTDAPPVHPPYAIRTERLLVRCWEPADAPALRESVLANREHLLPWMPWAHLEPQSVEDKVELLRTFRGRFDLGEDFVYGLFDPATSAILGGSGLHPRCGPGGLEIGYWVDRENEGRGFATEATAALARVGLELCGVERIEIHCFPENERSNAIPERLGFRFEGIERRRFPWHDGTLRDTGRWTLLREELAGSPAGSCAIECFDARGAPFAAPGMGA